MHDFTFIGSQRRSFSFHSDCLWSFCHLMLCMVILLCMTPHSWGHPFHLQRKDLQQQDPFRQLNEVWPTPNEYRLASGAPGPQYWQQKVDYDIDGVSRVLKRKDIFVDFLHPHDQGAKYIGNIIIDSVNNSNLLPALVPYLKI